jgi:hypothetical protein
MLMEMGVDYGRGVAKEVIGVTREPYLVLKTLEELSMAAGWGSVEAKGDAEHGTSLEVHVARCAFCAEGERVKEPCCDFLAGVRAGTASEAYQLEYGATETKCSRTGEPMRDLAQARKGLRARRGQHAPKGCPAPSCIMREATRLHREGLVAQGTRTRGTVTP